MRVSDIASINLWGRTDAENAQASISFAPITPQTVDFSELEEGFRRYSAILESGGISKVQIAFVDGTNKEIQEPRTGVHIIRIGGKSKLCVKFGTDRDVDRYKRRSWDVAALAYNYQKARATNIGCIVDACVCIPGIVEVMEECTPFTQYIAEIRKPETREQKAQSRLVCMKLTQKVRHVRRKLLDANVEARDFKAENLVMCGDTLKVIDMSQLRKLDDYRPVCPEPSTCVSTPYVSTFPMSYASAYGGNETPESVVRHGILLTWWGSIVTQIYIWENVFRWSKMNWVKSLRYHEDQRFNYIKQGVKNVRTLVSHAQDKGIENDLDGFIIQYDSMYHRPPEKRKAGQYINHQKNKM